MKNIHKIYFLLTFFVFFTLGALVFFLPQTKYSEDENTYLTTLPKVSVKKIMNHNFQDDFTEALNDQFFGRKFWIETATSFKKTLGIKDINDVYIGKDGYYFQKVTNSDIDDKKFDKSLRFVNLFETLNKNAYFMLIPSPESILSDKLPQNAYVYDDERLYNKVLKNTDKNHFIDTRKLLLEKSKENRVYFHTDHHWTLNGAYEGYRAFSGMVNEKSVPDNISDYTEKKEKKGSDEFYGTIYSKILDKSIKPDEIYIQKDIPKSVKVKVNNKDGVVFEEKKLKEKDKYGVFFGGNYAMMSITNDNAKTEKSILIIKDSFANSMIPYMLDDYKKIDVLDLRYYTGSLKSLIAENKYSEELILYEMSNFAEDINMFKLAL